jgi:hypothetical protein
MRQRERGLPSDVRRWLCLAGKLRNLNTGYALKHFIDNSSVRIEGAQPDVKAKRTAGQSRRRTSDGKARTRNDF